MAKVFLFQNTRLKLSIRDFNRNEGFLEDKILLENWSIFGSEGLSLISNDRRSIYANALHKTIHFQNRTYYSILIQQTTVIAKQIF